MKTFKEFKSTIVESKDSSMDPPNMLIMRRQSIRMYPNKQRVALYFVDKINKYITLPYTASQWSSSGPPVEEEFQSEEEIKD